MKYVAFDIEIAEMIPEGCDDWTSAQPGISCAATLTSDGELGLWHGARVGDRYAKRMYHTELIVLVDFLRTKLDDGYVPVTWNGAGFDFRVLEQEAPFGWPRAESRRMALDGIDPAFAMFCAKGFMVGLDATAKGMGLAGKLEGMGGALAPKMWAGSLADQERVLTYVAQDARTTAEVYERILCEERLFWLSKNGVVRRWALPWSVIPTVREALELPLPNTSWMTDPWKREKFVGWLGL